MNLIKIIIKHKITIIQLKIKIKFLKKLEGILLVTIILRTFKNIKSYFI